MTNKRKVGLIGARGYTGAELIRLIDAHSGLELTLASSRANVGQPVAGHVAGFRGALAFCDCGPAELAKQDLDVVILALPNALAANYVAAWDDAGRDGIILDLSADYRFDERWYYGLPELTRANARGRTRIANPGCYATAMQLALAPVVARLDGPPVCFGVSGYSGAGTKPSPKNDPRMLKDNLQPYSPSGHIHEREVSAQFGRQIRFTPHVAEFFRGISMTVSARLGESTDAAAIAKHYARFYADEPLVQVSEAIPLVAANAGHHHACVGGFDIGADGRDLVVFSTLDNLLKGAATQALQNINIACGYAEHEGLIDG